MPTGELALATLRTALSKESIVSLLSLVAM